MRVLFCFVALLAAVAAVDVRQRAHMAKAVLEPTQLHPAVRAFTTGSNFVFAVTNSHITNSDTSYTENITIIVTNYDSSNAASVTVSTPSGIFSTQTFSVQPLQNYQLTLPPEIQTDYRDFHVNYGYTTNQSISLTASTTVTVVVSNAHSDGLSQDMYVVYPTCMLGTRYRTVGDETFLNGARSTNIWSIVGTQDGTVITIDPPVTSPPTISINKGQVFTLAADIFPLTNYDLSTNYPVAVITGAVCGFGYFNPAICNYEAEMMFPLRDSGTQFPYSQFISEDAGEIMVFAHADGTTISINGVPFDTIDDGWYYIFQRKGSFLFSTSKPAYAVAVSSIRKDGKGSPFLAHIPAIDQFTNQTYLQVSTGLAGRTGAEHYIRLQTDLSNTGKLSVDDWPVNPLFFQRQGKSNTYIAEWAITPGTHTVKSSDPKATYAATVYGFAHFTAYAYTPGIDLPTNGTC
ncbi:unnamed protein product, partial [Mesorhabditis spiculigera]